jgi:ABC-type antimicrobial peptide transport system permease subunit
LLSLFARSAIGIYGVLSYSIRRQASAYGVRLALGAMPQGILWLVLKEALKLLAFALFIGIGPAVLFGYLMAAQLFGIAPYDPLTLTSSAVVYASLRSSRAICRPAARPSSIQRLR